MKHSIDKPILATTGLVGFTASLVGLSSCIGLVLVGSSVSADDVVDDISITVPVSCTMSGSGMNSHTAEIANGTYTPNIGTTTINVLCNDNGGFSIYAAGFTGEEIGATNSNKLVGTSASGNAVIDTGTATSAGNPDVSNWAMKLATNSQATYPISLSTGYDAYHAVPNEYTKVATRLQGTDVGTGATGSSLTTTYAAYISKTQPADTYSGKVKYTLVHPHDGAAPTPPPAPSSTCNTKVPGVTYMQELNSSNTATVMSNMEDNAQYYLRDARDEEPYCVSKIKTKNASDEDQYAIWMTQNLRITGTIPAEGSNFTGSDVNISECDLDSTVGECAGASDRNSYDIAMTHDSSNITKGVWYNYAAATAKTILGDINTTVATEDICPANWTLPSDDSNKPADSTDSLTSDTAVRNAFSPVNGGSYSGGSVYGAGLGYWWSTTVRDDIRRYGLKYGNNRLETYYNTRRVGYYIRCVRVAE